MAKQVDVERAWKDPSYLNRLSPEERSLVPPNPAGAIELSDDSLDSVVGGAAAQTGTGTPNCFCVLTRTADSQGGHCDCHCDTPPAET